MNYLPKLRKAFYSFSNDRSELVRAIFNEYDSQNEDMSLFTRLCMSEKFNVNELEEISNMCNFQENFIKYVVELHNAELFDDDKLMNNLFRKNDIRHGMETLIYIYFRKIDKLTIEILNDLLNLGLVKNNNEYNVNIHNDIDEDQSIPNEIVRESIVNLLSIKRQDRPKYLVNRNEISTNETLNSFRLYGPTITSNDRSSKLSICVSKGCMMFTCLCEVSCFNFFNNEDDNDGYLIEQLPEWFTGLCSNCESVIYSKRSSLRLPMKCGGWSKEIFCSKLCCKKFYREEHDYISFKKIYKMIQEYGIYETED